ncbi:hypothetical protein ABIF65_005509 [Bradyrhizobium japonicum]|uniref:hypothetical protein n=1 Tax=Bradyrhizobium TaxID=374 RepID=UPI0004B3AF01|nr:MULTISPECIES: hypothetical protein [Bradyrhizobium]MBR0884429.1 hypothetical protein [Bradyrhizobium liaoningense]MBR1071165.1 hypothetical protein [Bradyrhizobium liaoningense]MDI2078109.1 hypothetical protein [Bradyrhizobium sp. Mp27]
MAEIARAAAANLGCSRLEREGAYEEACCSKEQERLKEPRKMIGEDIEELRELIYKFRQKLH